LGEKTEKFQRIGQQVGSNLWKIIAYIQNHKKCRYLASIWTIRLFNRCCDICKDLRLEIPAIHSRYLQLGFVTGSLEASQLDNAKLTLSGI